MSNNENSKNAEDLVKQVSTCNTHDYQYTAVNKYVWLCKKCTILDFTPHWDTECLHKTTRDNRHEWCQKTCGNCEKRPATRIVQHDCATGPNTSSIEFIPLCEHCHRKYYINKMVTMTLE